ncbi:protein-L-isoaspartate O-methyltransferase [Cognatishimia sp. SS12]|uniref:protein-L-isoaspartate O-methyltransferase family protein n=1 Tax=Cognatishimia sp. SS12 TaxID=2979465 RepID=UPI00232B47E9|nr:protein-L-isoaspartate O-methyltransferase [Cognatishimia sp. SS12]MDC0739677.1 protein-L-isoaspartate O-methyltransferase [Cognatishimia sp. SS12]
MPDYTSLRTAMVDTQVRPSDVTKFPIIEAMLTVPREAFVPAAQRDAAYRGENLPLENGRVVLEPRTLAKMLDALNVSKDELVLDIGAALGYSSAVVARMAEAVVAVESDEDLAEDAQAALADHNIDNVVVHTGPLAEGAASHGPYDVIIVQGGVENLPEAIAQQLKDGGRIACVFMTGALGDVQIGHKTGSRIHWRSEFNAGAPVLQGFEKEVAFEL